MTEVRNIQNFINGEFSSSAGYIDSFDPSTGKVFARVPDSGAAEVEIAVAAAKQAFTEWSAKTISSRASILMRVADILERRREEFAQAESMDQGKPLWMARMVDMSRAVLNLKHFATTALSDREMAELQPNEFLNYTIRVPVGVVGIIVPWNFPLYLLTFKLAPALVYGNTAVVKPSEFTSVTAWMLCSVLQEAGVPPGVVNIVFGYGHKAGEAIVTHPDVQLISFTGSTRTGTHIAEVSAPFAKKISLEMGGKNAAIVFEDVDLEKCIPTLIKGSFSNQGQVCLATSRIYVHRTIFSDFTNKFVESTRKLTVGNPASKGIMLGPLNNKSHWEKVKRYLKLAREEGATFLCGDEREQERLNLPKENEQGYFVAPAVMTNLPPTSRCMQEEIFGPVTCIMPFDNEDEVVSFANGVPYGLCASLWSRDASRIHRVAPQLEVGTIWCNCWLERNLHFPFGGMKMSGVGREGTDDSKDFYTEKKTICVKIN